MLELESTGRLSDGAAGGEQRRIVAQLKKKGFLNFIYYTDFESSGPGAIADRNPQRRVVQRWFVGGDPYDLETVWDGFEAAADAERARTTCQKHWYEGGRDGSCASTAGVRYDGRWYDVSRLMSCDIQFAGGDTIDGPLHTNDAILLSDGATFGGETTSSWPENGDPAPDAANFFRQTTSGAQPNPAGERPQYGKPITMPPNNDALRRNADPAQGGRGCVYTGPTRITFRDDGRLHGPQPGDHVRTGGVRRRRGLGSPRTVDRPVQRRHLRGPGPGRHLRRQGAGHVPGERRPHPVQLQGRRRVRRRQGRRALHRRRGQPDRRGRRPGLRVRPGRGRRARAGGEQRRDHLPPGPVHLAGRRGTTARPATSATSTPPSPGALYDSERIVPGAPNEAGVLVSAAVLSVNRSFTVQNYDHGDELGRLKVLGGIYQRHRGAVGTSGSGRTGFLKDYRYDDRLPFLPPPFYLTPEDSSWDVVAFSEEDAS